MGLRFAGGAWVVAVLVAAVVAVPAGSAAVASGGVDAEAAGAEPVQPSVGWGEPSTASVQSIERDSILLRVDVRADGSARWRIEYRTRLDDPATRAAFRSLQESIREHPGNYSAAFFRRIHAAIAAAENATGREMSGGNFSVHTTVRNLPRAYGIVVYTFTWRGFAAVSGDTLRVGDTLSGFFLDERERLLVSWPAGYELRRVDPPADTRRDHVVAWSGPVEFTRNEPRLVLRERPGVVERWLPRATAAVAVAAAAALVAWGVRRRRGVRAPPRLRDDGEPPSDAELLSNEERVLRLLERRGGRVKQQEVVDELDWTEAKTSQVVGDLRAQGRIESFRLGRENVLSLSEASADGGERAGDARSSSDP